MLVSIKKLSELTGRHRQTIAKILADLPLVDGQKGAHLYDSREALPLIYAVDNLETARAEQARSQAALNKVREENLRKQRIPIELGTTLDQALQAMAATLKAAKDKVLTVELINNIFEDFRAIPAKLKWWRSGSTPVQVCKMEPRPERIISARIFARRIGVSRASLAKHVRRGLINAQLC